MAAPLIQVKDLECRYGERTVLRGVTFSVARSELFFVIGPNGSGKSTLLRHMIGLMNPARGEIRYGGKPYLGRQSPVSFGVLFQNGALWSSMTIAENISLPVEERAALTSAETRRLVALKLAQVGLPGIEDLTPSELSGGMRKRAALARALALDPPIVFFDEPSSGLDPISTRQLNNLILRVRETMGTTMVIVSHHIESILDIADRAILLDGAAKGVIAEGVPRELARDSRDPRVRAFFGETLV
jgi:phospholipid/cholesterol/gamma-HCH transport system ATP-binding protein